MGDVSPLVYAFVFLLVALVTVPVAKRLGMGQAVGYLIAGFVVGPWGLSIVSDLDTVSIAVQVSTLLLLFLVALQATPARMRMLAKDFFSLSMLHLGLTTVTVLGVCLLIGLPWHHALACGLTLSLSSSALANQAFDDSYPAGSPLTDTGRRLLLSQNLAVVPILVFFPLLSFEAMVTQGSSWPMVIRSLVLVAAFALFGQYLLRHLFRFVVAIELDEVFAAFALMLIVGSLMIAQLFAIPMELGAVLAGLLLTRSEYGSAINIAVRPFREFLVGLFFISVGMTINLSTFIGKPLRLTVLAILLVAIKAWALRKILRYSSVPRVQRIWLATVLSQSGELAFIVIAFAVSYQTIPSDLGSELTVIVALSMLTTPVLLMLAHRRGIIPAQQQVNTGLESGAVANSHVIIAGYGRVGQTIAKLLKQNNYRVAVIDQNPLRYDAMRKDDFVGFYGDALRPDLLSAAGIDNAAVLVVALDNRERNEELIVRIRREYPSMTIVARAYDSGDKQALLECGADSVYLETFESALLMGEDILEHVGVSPLDAQAMAETFRDSEQT